LRREKGEVLLRCKVEVEELVEGKKGEVLEV
jgi:hypothetical protein